MHSAKGSSGRLGAQKLLIILACAMSLGAAVLVGCGGDKKVSSLRTASITPKGKGTGGLPKPRDDESGEDNPEVTDPLALPPATSLTEKAAFERSVYPLLKDHCAGCHASIAGPFIGHDDVEVARVAVETGKVNFKDVMSSRLYLRLATDKHECWGECSANAEEMKAALDRWVGFLLEINPKFLDDLAIKNVTDARALRNAEMRQVLPDPKTASVEAEVGTLTAPFASRQDAALGVNYIEVPVGPGARRINDPNQQGAGGVVVTVMAPVAGKYQIWARINTATTDNDEIYVRVDNGVFEEWKAPVTMANWSWVAANRNSGREALNFDLTAGAHTIELRRREAGFKIDAIALTANTEFDGSQLDTRPVQVLRYDISTLSGKPDTFFEIEVSKYSDESIMLRRPTVIAATMLRIKNIRVLINGKYNPQHNTFNFLDV